MENEKQVWITNISYEATESQLTKFLSQAGPVVSVKLLKGRDSSKHKGQAIATFEHNQIVEIAVRNLDRKEFCGRTISIKASVDPSWKSKKSSFKNVPLIVDRDLELILEKNFTNEELAELLTEFRTMAENSTSMLRELLMTYPVIKQFLLHLLKTTSGLKNQDFNVVGKDFTPAHFGHSRRKRTVYLRNLVVLADEDKLFAELQKVIDKAVKFDVRADFLNGVLAIEFLSQKDAEAFAQKFAFIYLCNNRLVSDYTHAKEPGKTEDVAKEFLENISTLSEDEIAKMDTETRKKLESLMQELEKQV